METTHTRESWLNAVASELWPMIERAGGKRPESFRVSCGWPSRLALARASSSTRRIGECWTGGSEDGAREIFVSPALAHPVEVADVLLHEMIHAALPEGVGHRHPFPQVARKVGLEGKPTATHAGEELVGTLTTITKGVGPYPHAKLDAVPKAKQKARLMKVECPDCGYTCRITRMWLDLGLPTCPCGSVMESVEYKAAGEPLKLAESHVIYSTEDGRFALRTSKIAGREGHWYLTDLRAKVVGCANVEGVLVLTHGEPRVAIRRSRDDALAFIGAVRNGETEFPEADVQDDEDGDLGDLGWDEVEDDFIEDDEDEVPDYPDDQPDDWTEFEVEHERRSAAGERKSLSIASGSEDAMD